MYTKFRYKKKAQLTQTEREAIENAIAKSGKTFKELSEQFGVFEESIRSIAEDMGITGLENPAKEDNIIATVKSTDKKTDKRRKYTILSDLQKEKIRKSYSRGNISKAELARRFGVSDGTIARVLLGEALDKTAKENHEAEEDFKEVHEEEKKSSGIAILEKEKVEAIRAIELTAQEKRNVVEIPIIESGELVPLSKFTNIKTLVIRLDPTLNQGGVNITLFTSDVIKLKSSFDFEEAIKSFFEKNIVGKKVNVLKIYWKTSGNDRKITALITKYCMLNECNLSFIAYGMSEEVIIDSFSENNKNIQRLSASGLDSHKLLYKTNYDNLRDTEVIYALHMVYQPNTKQVIICDTYDKVLEVFMRLQKQYNGTPFKGVLYKIADGYQSSILTTVTAGFIDSRNN